ncbi:unnamed protein product [Rotaria magnacalcarata]|uniref:ubiquitinyl hydrolase 1 n=1 Tax=Rotaria magnacalcarata TaxID=392030 RepID=A0A816QBP3_9BILA|nr:unnamed protein product [Rotaria magnacalcarata]CAF4127739.1 unnamed protein product [Rotaria magnacalcarata]
MQQRLKMYFRDVLDESDEILHVKYQLIYTVGAQQQVHTGAKRCRNYHRKDKQIILSFILKPNSSIDDLNNNFSDHQIQLFLILRGLLLSDVLIIALKKRHRVNYGINSNHHFKRLMAVPFRAKDVASDRTEFGHPDVALILTHLSYYSSVLNDQQLLKCFHRLSEEKDPTLIYDQWISYDEKDQISSSIQEWKSVNLRHNQQRIHFLFPTFRNNIGTNDTQLLLPVHICQNDLPELQKTDAIVVNNLLKSENENYQTLAMNTTSKDILHQIVNYHQSINVILDVGGLFTDGTNREIAMEWLKISHKMKIHYVVYFDADRIYVCDRQYHHYPFSTSPACERLDSCIFYLDDIHTRGTDFKFPVTFKAALTLGNGLTKDRFVQAAMRMRKLGSGHSLAFWSSYEVHQQIMKLKRKKENTNNFINVIDILRWVYENTQQATWDGLNLWASQSLTFQRIFSAFRNIQWNNHQQIFTDELMERLAKECLEPEIIELKHMYGSPRVAKTLFDIYHARYQQINHNLLTDIQEEVLKRLIEYGGKKLRLSQLLDEEQQKELEKDLEKEHQLVERPSSVIEHESMLHRELDRLCDTDGLMLKLDEFPTVFRRLPYAFIDTTFSTICQSDSRPDNFWVSTEFQRVIATQEKSLNPFLRPPRWIIIYRNQHLIFLSSQEANHLIGRLKNLYYIQKSDEPPVTTVRLILPRTRRGQSILVNNTMLTTSPLNKFPSLDNSWRIPFKWLAQLFVFNGTLYFENVEEQRAYCQLLSLCPKPRTEEEEEAFEKGWIDMNGFVSNPKHRRQLQMNQGQFNANPIRFVKQLIENRNKSHASILSYVGSIILNSRKLSFN